MKKGVILLVFLICQTSLFSQSFPSLAFSTNSCSSLIQDALNNVLKKDSSFKKYSFLAPSFCYMSAEKIAFTVILTSNNVDYSKINPLIYCGDLKKAADDIENMNAIPAFALCQGSVQIAGDILVIQLENYEGSKNENQAIPKLLLEKFSQISLDNLNDIKINYGKYNYEHLKLSPSFSKNGLRLYLDSNRSINELQINETVNQELQATGVSSIATYLPFDFINTILSQQSFRYELNDKDDFRFSNGSISRNETNVYFSFNFAGKVEGYKLVNSYQIKIYFNQNNFTIKDALITRISGNNGVEEALVKKALSALLLRWKGYFLPAINDDNYFFLKQGSKAIQLSVSTLFGHIENQYLVLVNSIEIKKP